MSIDRVSANSVNIRQYSTKRQPQFTGVSTSAIKNEINAMQNPLYRWFSRFGGNIGELQDVCVNAVGTGLIAPIFIKYNPLSKTDEDTRTYSAWRQPLSAVLAVCTSGLITIPFSRLVKKMANEGYFVESLNKTPFQDEDYILKQQKKLHPNLSETELHTRVDRLLKDQKDVLETQIRNSDPSKGDTIKYTYTDFIGDKTKTKQKSMSAEKFNKLLLDTVADMKKSEQAQLDRIDKEKFPNRLARSEYFRTHYSKAQPVLESIKEKIAKTDNIEEIRKFIKDKQKSVKSDKQLNSMLNETLDRLQKGQSKVDAEEKINKMLTHINKYKTMSSAEEVKQAVIESLKNEKNEYSESVSFLDKISEQIGKGKRVRDIEEYFRHPETLLKDMKGKKFRLANKNFVEKVGEQLSEMTKRRIDGCKRIANLIVALAVLPVACTALNWIYPRFMAAVFPNLSNKKHGNESKELVERASGGAK